MKKLFTIIYDYIYKDGTVDSHVYSDTAEGETLEEAIDSVKTGQSDEFKTVRLLSAELLDYETYMNAINDVSDEMTDWKLYSSAERRLRDRIAWIAGRYDNRDKEETK